MIQAPQLRLKLSASPWRAGLCLVLAALFVYNPFLTIYGASRAATIQRPLSWRATVASSELWRKAELSQAMAPSLEILAVCEQTHPAPTNEVIPAANRDFSRSAVQVFCDNLWFRPPPVA